MPQSPSTVKQYAGIVLQIARLKQLSITLSSDSWYRTRAALRWALSHLNTTQSAQEKQHLSDQLQRFFKKKEPQSLRGESGKSKARALNSKKYSAAKMLQDHSSDLRNEGWRDLLWPALTHKHKSAIAAMFIMPLRPIDVSKGISIKVTRANRDSHWGKAAVLNGTVPPDTIEFICQAGKQDFVQFFDAERQGMVQTSLQKGQAWRRFIFKLDDSPWLRYLEQREGMPIDLGGLKHARSISSVIQKAAKRAGLGDHLTANTLRHLVISEFKAFAADGKMRWEDICKAASHSSAVTTRTYGHVHTGRQALRSGTSFEPPQIESAQPVRKLAGDSPRLESLPVRHKKLGFQPEGPLASPRMPKPKGCSRQPKIDPLRRVIPSQN